MASSALSSRARSVTFSYVSFTHQPDDVRELEQLLDCEVRPGGSWAGLAMPRSAWQLPLSRRDPILRAMLEHQADASAPRAPALDGLAMDVRRVLALRLARGEAEIDRVARDLAMSPRTLQRRLSSAGLSYQGLLDVLRRETAEKCIADASLTIAEIAYLAGYSEPPAFSSRVQALDRSHAPGVSAAPAGEFAGRIGFLRFRLIDGVVRAGQGIRRTARAARRGSRLMPSRYSMA